MTEETRASAGWGIDLFVGVAAGGVLGALLLDTVANLLWPFMSPGQVFGSALQGWDWEMIGVILGAVVGIALMRVRRARRIAAGEHQAPIKKADSSDVDPPVEPAQFSEPSSDLPAERHQRPLYLLTISLAAASLAVAATWIVATSDHRSAQAERETEVRVLETRAANLEGRLADAERDAADARSEARSARRELDQLRGSSPVTRTCASSLETQGLRLNQIDWYAALVGLLQATTTEHALALSLDPSNVGWLCVYGIDRASIEDTVAP